MTGTHPVRRSVVIVATALVMATTPALAQTSDESSPPGEPPAPTMSAAPGVATTALCTVGDGDEPAGARSAFAMAVGASAGARAEALVADEPYGPGSAGCMAPTVEIADPLGDGMRTMFALPDPTGDGSLDVVRTLWAPVMLTRAEARALRRDDDISVAGARSRAIRSGESVLVGLELGSGLASDDAVHVATDAEDDPTRRVPSTVSVPVSPLSGIRDLYTHHRQGDGVRALHSDLATGEYYTGDRAFATWMDDMIAWFLIPANGMGPDFRPVAFKAGEGATPDAAGLGAAPGLMATSGRFGWTPDCIEQLLVHEPLVLEGVEVSFSTDWVTFCFHASEVDLELLEEFIDDIGNDAGVAEGEIRFTLLEEGVEREQTVPLDVWTEGDRVYLAFPVGLKAYGFHALMDVAIRPTDDLELDDIFREAADGIVRRLNPTSFDATPGRLQGDRECATPPGRS